MHLLNFYILIFFLSFWWIHVSPVVLICFVVYQYISGSCILIDCYFFIAWKLLMFLYLRHRCTISLSIISIRLKYEAETWTAKVLWDLFMMVKVWKRRAISLEIKRRCLSIKLSIWVLSFDYLALCTQRHFGACLDLCSSRS